MIIEDLTQHEADMIIDYIGEGVNDCLGVTIVKPCHCTYFKEGVELLNKIRRLPGMDQTHVNAWRETWQQTARRARDEKARNQAMDRRQRGRG